jgi:hypothetical protein
MSSFASPAVTCASSKRQCPMEYGRFLGPVEAAFVWGGSPSRPLGGKPVDDL